MDVDWITVAAQIVNFLVLVWLLQRFLYGPIIRVMDERDAQIAQKLREAQQKKDDAEVEAGRYRDMQESFEKQREDRLEKVQEEVDNFRKSLQAAAREVVAAQRAEWLRSLADEKVAFLNDIQERSAESFLAMARRALSDLANEALEDQIARRLLTELRDLDEPDRRKIQGAYERAGATVAVRTAFNLRTKRRNEINAALCDTLGKDIETAFERSPDLICGVELRVGGQMVRWSLDSFLDELESELREAVESRTPVSDRRAAE